MSLNRRFSQQKKMIKDALSLLDHPTAAEVYEEIRKDYPQISLGTVYRNLSLMAEEHEILRLSFEGSPDRFDPNVWEHYHIVCERCGRIADTDRSLQPELLSRLDGAVEEATGFRVSGRSLVFRGLCPRCREGIS